MRLNFGLPTCTTDSESFDSMKGLRPRLGRSVSFWLSITWPVEASAVSMRVASAVTLTCSLTWPSSSVRSMVTAVCVETTTPVRAAFLKPGASATTV